MIICRLKNKTKKYNSLPAKGKKKYNSLPAKGKKI